MSVILPLSGLLDISNSMCSLSNGIINVQLKLIVIFLVDPPWCLHINIRVHFIIFEFIIMMFRTLNLLHTFKLEHHSFTFQIVLSEIMYSQGHINPREKVKACFFLINSVAYAYFLCLNGFSFYSSSSMFDYSFLKKKISPKKNI